MYKYRYVPALGDARPAWMGEFETRAAALAAGRQQYSDAKAIEVAKVRVMTFSELMPNPRLLFSILQQRAEHFSDDEDEISNGFDLLPFARKAQLQAILQEVIEEWESDLPSYQQLQAVVAINRIKYWPDEVVR